MKNLQDNNFFTRILSNRQNTNTLYKKSLFAPVHFFHVTYSKINKLWYVKEIDGPTHSVHLSKERALQEANNLATYDENGQVVLQHENGILEIIDKFRQY
ncbi:MAG: hypothetical protein HYX35_01500 [Proteobacteria bacterium]|nr:hypothetical protein [Pseudomonadota bacterium]